MKATVYSNWGYWDHLDGKELVDGERVRVTWPDGSVSEHTIAVKKTSYQISEMGSPTTIPVVEAFVQVNARGALVLVRLVESGCDVERA